MLHTTELEFSYDHKMTLSFPSIDLEKKKGLLVLGTSGSGKTTLLHLIAGFIQPDKGNIQINKNEVTLLSEADMDRFRGANIGFVFQQSRLIAALSVYDNLLIGQYFNKHKNRKKIDDLLEELGLASKKARKPSSLSLGEQQRLSIARALVNDPALILADEPTAALDDTNAEKVIHLLRDQAEKHNAALLMATHDKRVKDHFTDKIELT